ncbi:HTH-type transcriptional repressor CarH [Anaerolineae bacterium]|nr:HTH-type transcriptional repressor CarH [Anaerolineae bacterium]
MDRPSTQIDLSELSTDPAYNVKAVCLKTGITPATLRAWERRYGIPSPQRSPQGYRLYSERDLALIRWLIEQTRLGLNIGQAIQQLRGVLSHEGSLLIKQPSQGFPSVTHSPRSPQAIAGELSEALIALDEGRADGLLTEALVLYSLETTLADMVCPVFEDIRAQSRSHRYPLTIERFALSHLRQWLLTLILNAPPARMEQRIVTLGIPGEHNELILLMIGLLLRRSGYPVAHLGTDLSPAYLGSQIDHLRGALALCYVDDPAHARHLIEWIVSTNPAEQKTRWVVAGRALPLDPAPQAQAPIESVGAELRGIMQKLLKYLRERTTESPQGDKPSSEVR